MERANWPCRQAALYFATLFVAAITYGQSTSASSTNNSSVDQAIPPAVAKELDALKKRIEALETELKNSRIQAQLNEASQQVPANTTEQTNAAPVVTTRAGSSPRGVEPNSPDQTAAAAQSTPAEPFSFADFSWLTGNSRETESPLETKVFTGELRVDTDYVYDFNHPADHSIGGSSEVFRAGEVQLTQFGIGGDFHWNNVRGRLMTQFGMYSETTPRNDASPARGQWDLDTAYRYISEAYGGYHFNKWNGINVDAGIFMSYVGLFSYYQFDNWAYQPSYVSSNTPWFFNGVRVQIFPTEKLKIEPWFVNGWQSYGTFNKSPGLGLQILYRPAGWLSILGNQYEGADTLGISGRRRVHTDDSVQIKYYDNPARLLDKAAMTITVDAGCEFGSNSGVHCSGGNRAKPSQYFLGFMTYQRFWFHKDLFGFTIGGGAINNPGRYLVLLPPINGATAITGTPYFTENPGDPYKAWDTSATFDYMPKQFITWRFEYNHRASNVPYFTGPGGITPPGGNNGSPGLLVPGWNPDLRKRENRLIIAILVKL
ncbi:MAG: outer membrane beta-barrel protein [Acidobacteriaceae bacterium]|nr:outer membrane beta-barrel protein [Acidobacteriaceae bacterium]MBV9781918.1 outer membrane beta-barrel protein [Acidobacteriaceae bacterium]